MARVQTAQDSANDRPCISRIRAQLSISVKCFQSNQQVLPIDSGQGRKFGPIHDFYAIDRALTRNAEAKLERIVFVDVDCQRPPQGNTTLTGSCSSFHLGFDPGRTIRIDVAGRRKRGRMSQPVIGRRDAQRMEIWKTLEDRTHRIACALGNLAAVGMGVSVFSRSKAR